MQFVDKVKKTKADAFYLSSKEHLVSVIKKSDHVTYFILFSFFDDGLFGAVR